MSDSENEEVHDLTSPDVTTKYRSAGDIVNKALTKVAEACVADADIATLCEMGDTIMEEETGKLYNKKVSKGEDKPEKKIEKGIAFPTCISVNEVTNHFSPMKGESKTLQKGDVVKIDLACHLDGFIAAAAHTIVIGDDKVEDKRADVVMAAWNAAEAALRLVKEGNTNTMVTEAIGQVAEEFKCKPMQGILSHEMKKFIIEGERVVANTQSVEEKVEEFKFGANEVYCIDIMMSTGEGKSKETECRHTVYKRAVENSYNLKTQKARQFISEVNKRFPALPFSLRAISDEQVARVGVSEAKRHELLEEYPVMKEKDKEFVAQFKFTVLLLPGGTKKITGLPVDQAQIASSLSIQNEELKKLIASSANPKKQKKKKAKEEKSGADAQ
eukprot:TRINITY_DN3246_c0_g1_i2.p1 TRINITY_DN3246_c0_g1~~TRINITY_DN3246_c0_g1_i2.p1  ORF type:complete len:414 (+),score=97.91 TRINITY_DN3246_c0_g1_i2:85-1242(+)